jgi:hypothetical protein
MGRCVANCMAANWMTRMQHDAGTAYMRTGACFEIMQCTCVFMLDVADCKTLGHNVESCQCHHRIQHGECWIDSPAGNTQCAPWWCNGRSVRGCGSLNFVHVRACTRARERVCGEIRTAEIIDEEHDDIGLVLRVAHGQSPSYHDERQHCGTHHRHVEQPRAACSRRWSDVRDLVDGVLT